jgi:hypothetical protein
MINEEENAVLLMAGFTQREINTQKQKFYNLFRVEPWLVPMGRKPLTDAALEQPEHTEQTLEMVATCKDFLQVEQEPVAWRTFDGEGGYEFRYYQDNEEYQQRFIERNGEQYASWVEPLYTAPPKREWQSLTDEDIDWIKGSANRALGYIRVTAAKLKEKNT